MNSYSLFLTVLELWDPRLNLQITDLKLVIGHIPEFGVAESNWHYANILRPYISICETERKALQEAPELLPVGSRRVYLVKDCSVTQGISC